MATLSRAPQVSKDNIRAADMDKTMIDEAIDITCKAITKFEIQRQIAQHVKQHFDRTYYPNWHCIVGKNYSSVISYESRHYINFNVGDLNVMLFKYG